MPTEDPASLKRTPLYPLHRSLGARMVPFAGYEMPVQYPTGILAEHLHTRAQAGLFDVSHMGQLRISGAEPAEALEAVVPSDIRGLGPMRMRYTLLLDELGGILDDLMVTRFADRLLLVVNAATKDADFDHLRAHLSPTVRVERLEDRALLALQGPMAAVVLKRFAGEIAEMPFMSAAETTLDGNPCLITRSGYTGEDGFEISLPATGAAALAERLLAEPEVAPVGLGARDSLRLEAGMCLYGHDIDQTTTPVEANLTWTIPKNRRRERRFPGRFGRSPPACAWPGTQAGRHPPRWPRSGPRRNTYHGSDGNEIGRITSGGFGPSLGAPVAMGYVDSAHAAPGTALSLTVRGSSRPAQIVRLPFVPHRYHRG